MTLDLTTAGWMLLGLSLAAAFAFEVVSACHDTANAVATELQKAGRAEERSHRGSDRAAPRMSESAAGFA